MPKAKFQFRLNFCSIHKARHTQVVQRREQNGGLVRKRSHPGCKLKESFPQMMVGEGLIWIFLLACGAAKSYVMIASAIALFA
jgi:hypothetical protein